MITSHWLARRALAGIGAFLLVSSLALQAAAQSPKSSAAAAPAAKPGLELTATDVEAFLGGFVPAQIERQDIAGAVSAFAFERARWYENQNFNLVILIFTLGLFLLSLLLWPVAALCRRHYGKPLQLTGEERKLRRRTRLIALLNLVAFGGWVGILSTV